MTTRVEPEWALVTLLFVDIRGFTSFADRSTAHEAVAYLNEFFELVIPLVTRQGGQVNKLLGDGLLAVFTSPDHADRGLNSAREMLVEVDAQFGDRCRIGIGINSGLVLMGTIGGGDRHEIAVIGDPVNVAARVQDATRELGQPLLLTDATRRLLEKGHVELEESGELALKGRREPVAVYAPERADP